MAAKRRNLRLRHSQLSFVRIAADRCSSMSSSRPRLQAIFVVESAQDRHVDHAVIRAAECRDCAAELKRRQRLCALLSETFDLAVNDVNADRVRVRITHAIDRERRSWQRIARLGAVAAPAHPCVSSFWTRARSVESPPSGRRRDQEVRE